MDRGQYKVMLVDGTETVHEGKPPIAEIERLIGCDALDTVTLDRKRQTVMFLDDTGMLTRKPVNEKATAQMKQAFGQQYPYSIHGHVVICNDGDFA
jgi:hypothetical protein